MQGTVRSKARSVSPRRVDPPAAWHEPTTTTTTTTTTAAVDVKVPETPIISPKRYDIASPLGDVTAAAEDKKTGAVTMIMRRVIYHSKSQSSGKANSDS